MYNVGRIGVQFVGGTIFGQTILISQLNSRLTDPLSLETRGLRLKTKKMYNVIALLPVIKE